MSKRVTEKRDIELENIVGNLVIAEYQRDKLQSRLSEGVGKCTFCLRNMRLESFIVFRLWRNFIYTTSV